MLFRERFVVWIELLEQKLLELGSPLWEAGRWGPLIGAGARWVEEEVCPRDFQ